MPVLQDAVRNLQQQYPGLRIVGSRNGYFDIDNAADVAEHIRRRGRTSCCWA